MKIYKYILILLSMHLHPPGVSCIDGIELSKLTMTPIDGRNR